jgi:arylsulfatase A-like enzyme
VACVPSHAPLLTGQYPSLHGASQTGGAAKGAADPEQFWLDSSMANLLAQRRTQKRLVPQTRNS